MTTQLRTGSLGGVPKQPENSNNTHCQCTMQVHGLVPRPHIPEGKRVWCICTISFIWLALQAGANTVSTNLGSEWSARLNRRRLVILYYIACASHKAATRLECLNPFPWSKDCLHQILFPPCIIV